MSLIPCGHRIVVRPEKVEETDEVFSRAKAAGLALLERDLRIEQISVDKGTVLAIGDTAFKDFGGEPWCSVGDTVAYARHGGKLVKDPTTNEHYLLLNDEDIICKVVKD
ncbi:MAG TPA: co-chaperone GroES family protein [Methanosarcina sp.]|nr:co-chaperone GroES family protein [Methanosarcina sp.]